MRTPGLRLENAVTARAFLCNPDLEMAASGLGAPSGAAWDHAHATARLFALLGTPHSTVWLARGRELVELDGDALRQEAEQLGLYNAKAAQGFPWNRDGAPLVAYAWDDRANVAAAHLGLKLASRTGITLACNDKRFSHAHSVQHGMMPGVFSHACVVEGVQELARHLVAVPPAVSARWVLKPVQGFAGTGLIHGHGRVLSSRARGRLTALLQRDGAVVFEPWVERTADLSVQLWVPPAPAAVEVVAITALHNTPSGRYQGNGDDTALLQQTVAAARDAALQAGGWLQQAGHTGAAGVDAFTYVDPESNAVILRPITEINARFTLGLLGASVARMAFAAGRPWRFELEPQHTFGMWNGRPMTGGLLHGDPAAAAAPHVGMA